MLHIYSICVSPKFGNFLPKPGEVTNPAYDLFPPGPVGAVSNRTEFFLPKPGEVSNLASDLFPPGPVGAVS